MYQQEPFPLQQISELDHTLSVTFLQRRLQGRDGDNTAVCTVFLRALNEAGADAVYGILAGVLRRCDDLQMVLYGYIKHVSCAYISASLHFRMPQTLNILPLLRRLAMYSRTGPGSAISL